MFAEQSLRSACAIARLALAAAGAADGTADEVRGFLDTLEERLGAVEDNGPSPQVRADAAALEFARSLTDIADTGASIDAGLLDSVRENLGEEYQNICVTKYGFEAGS